MTTNRIPASDEERLSALSRRVSDLTLRGWLIIERNDREFTAVLGYPGRPVNHVLHGIITFITCLLWGIVWIILAASSRKEQRMRIQVGPDLNFTEERFEIE